ncbi:MAG TPA: DUF2062 domain-containing protein [Polyangiaceae bacterium]|nr:DUF2062 domain-containing protein [Polyangiaceae bacterium]
MTARRRTDLRSALRDAWRRLRGGELRPERAAGSVGVGLFVGFLPTYGIQTLICLMFTVPLKLDFPVAWVATNIANPLTALFIIALDIEVGGFVRRGEWATISTSDFDVAHLGALSADAMLGGVALGLAAGLVGGMTTLGWMRRAVRMRASRAHSSTRTPST